jgi:hypothetical protein
VFLRGKFSEPESLFEIPHEIYFHPLKTAGQALGSLAFVLCLPQSYFSDFAKVVFNSIIL